MNALLNSILGNLEEAAIFRSCEVQVSSLLERKPSQRLGEVTPYSSVTHPADFIENMFSHLIKSIDKDSLKDIGRRDGIRFVNEAQPKLIIRNAIASDMSLFESMRDQVTDGEVQLVSDIFSQPEEAESFSKFCKQKKAAEAAQRPAQPTIGSILKDVFTLFGSQMRGVTMPTTVSEAVVRGQELIDRDPRPLIEQVQDLLGGQAETADVEALIEGEAEAPPHLTIEQEEDIQSSEEVVQVNPELTQRLAGAVNSFASSLQALPFLSQAQKDTISSVFPDV